MTNPITLELSYIDDDVDFEIPIDGDCFVHLNDRTVEEVPEKIIIRDYEDYEIIKFTVRRAETGNRRTFRCSNVYMRE